MKKYLSCIICFCFLLSGAITAYAIDDTNTASLAPDDFGTPIQESTYTEEGTGNIVTERVYFVPDQEGVSLRGKSGKGWYKNEKTYTWNNGHGKTTTYYAQGYFVWGDGNVSVSSPSGGYDYAPSDAQKVTFSKDSGTGKYGNLFNQFAYVTYELHVTNVVGFDTNLSTTIRVSESGNLI